MKHVYIQAILFLLATFTSGATEWYRSGPGGVPGSPMGIGPLVAGWSLSVDYSEERETRSLYADARLQSRTVFTRNLGKLIARDEIDSQGKLLSRVEYAYDTAGNPRGIFIRFEDGNANPVHVETDVRVNPDGMVRRHTSGAEGDWLISDYNNGGQPLTRKTLSDGAVTSEIFWKRAADGTLNEEMRQVGDTEYRKRFDAGGRVLEEVTNRGGSVVQIRDYTWTGSNLTRVVERGEGITTIREIAWSGDRMVSEIRSVDGVIISKIEYSTDLKRSETLYRDGNAIVRVFWDGDNRIREEFLRNGEVIRVREAGQ